MLYSLTLETFGTSNDNRTLFIDEEKDIIIVWYLKTGCTIYKLSTGVKISQMTNTESSSVEIGFAGSDQIISDKINVKLKEGYYNITPAQLNVPNLTIYKKIDLAKSNKYGLQKGVFLDDNTFVDLKYGINFYNISTDTKTYFYNSSHDAYAVAVKNDYCLVFIDNKVFCIKRNSNKWSGIWSRDLNFGNSYGRLDYKYYFDSNFLYINTDIPYYEYPYKLKYFKIDLSNGNVIEIDSKTNFGWFNSKTNEWVALSKIDYDQGNLNSFKTVISSIKDANNYL